MRSIDRLRTLWATACVGWIATSLPVTTEIAGEDAPASAATCSDEVRIAAIAFEGLVRVEDAALCAVMTSRVDQPYSARATADHIRAIYAMG